VVRAAAAALRAARPTAVNLAGGVDRTLARLEDGPDAVLVEAVAVLNWDVRRHRELGERLQIVFIASGETQRSLQPGHHNPLLAELHGRRVNPGHSVVHRPVTGDHVLQSLTQMRGAA
jgi:hypothetical protein